MRFAKHATGRMLYYYQQRLTHVWIGLVVLFTDKTSTFHCKTPLFQYSTINRVYSTASISHVVRYSQYAPIHINPFSNETQLQSISTTKVSTSSLSEGPDIIDKHAYRGQDIIDKHTYRGVTSLLGLDSHSVIAGTKQGALIQINFTFNDDESYSVDMRRVDNDVITQCRNNNESESKLKFPIYKLGRYKHTIFGGSADRFVTIWGREFNSERSVAWVPQQKLGPHTGWVKDVIYDAAFTHRLYSIGCNYIEVWKEEQSDNNQRWKSHCKLVVERSSSSKGATLSTDLLCLCLVSAGSIRQGDNKSKIFLVAGGVDGQIHFWQMDDIQIMKKEIIYSIPAHDGRIHVLSYDATNNILFSTSHDGFIKCWSIQLNDPDSEVIVSANIIAELQLFDADNQFVRITALVLDTNEGANILIAGSQNGSIYLIGININDDGTILSSKTTNRLHLKLISQTTILNEPMINALHFVPGETKATKEVLTDGSCASYSGITETIVLVAHSLGIGIVSFS